MQASTIDLDGRRTCYTRTDCRGFDTRPSSRFSVERPMIDPMNVLVLTQTDDDCARISALLDHQSNPVHVEHAPAFHSGLERLGHHLFDLVLLDQDLPDIGGIEAVTALQRHDPDLPIILLMEAEDEQVSLRAVQAGAQDTLVKTQLTAPLLIRAIRYAIERKRSERERRRLEAQMQYAQKLESLGVLAGGIAHDFNNLLMTIVARAGLALRTLPPEEPGREHLKHIEKAGLRGGELANQMLTYAGRGKPAIQAVNVSKLIEQMSHLLQISVSKRAVLNFDLASQPPSIQADPSQIRQMVMNLVTNASEAIDSQGGCITVSTGTMHAQSELLATQGWHIAGDLPTRSSVYIEVRDTGCGMTKDTLPKIFDPFFTTKFTGRGLGLAALLGIVRAHGGAAAVKSRSGIGTEFRLIFPTFQRSKVECSTPLTPRQDWRTKGTVLVVDDEEDVRIASQLILEEVGLRVLTAEDGQKGVQTFAEQHETITAVLLDLTMPGLSGEQVCSAIRRIKPHVPIILSSGYTEEEALKRFGQTGIAGFIQKPYQVEALIEKVRGVLDAPHRQVECS